MKQHTTNKRGAVQPSRAAGARGFTLLELLVVIAIIGLLAALLLPALGRAKALAQRVACGNRAKQWAVAFKMYTDDNKSLMPREGWEKDGEVLLNTWSMVAAPDSADVWYNALSPHIGRPGAASYSLPRQNRPNLYRSASFFQCPGAPIPKDALQPNYYYSHPFALFSLAMNSKLIDAPNLPTTSFSRIRYPSETVLYLDNLMDDEKPVYGTQAWDQRGQPAAYANRFAGNRHGSSGNLSFADGHVDTIQGREVVATNGLDIFPPVKVRWYIDP